jgi:hypothetical protein
LQKDNELTFCLPNSCSAVISNNDLQCESL